MIIDVHGHVTAPDKLYAYKSTLLSHRGAHGRGATHISDAQLLEALNAPHPSFGNVSHLTHLDEAGIDLQLTSPRPFQMMHSESPAFLVEWFTAETNDVIARIADLVPGRFKGLAGLPQSMELEPRQWMAELRRCVNDLGFVGCLLNTDPYEGTQQPPKLSDRFWYPVWETLCELDVPALIHAGACRPPARENYSLHFIQEETLAVIALVNSQVFKDFPDLKIIVSHGGGAIPYQRGRYTASAVRGGGTFEDQLRKLYFDTCLYTRDSIELLLGAVGVDRCLFGSEKPGTGSVKDPATGRWIDDIHLLIEDIESLGDKDRQRIFETNAKELFHL
jgi:predicted TIM-barrel fold metal-dependent hydrolase